MPSTSTRLHTARTELALSALKLVSAIFNRGLLHLSLPFYRPHARHTGGMYGRTSFGDYRNVSTALERCGSDGRSKLLRVRLAKDITKRRRCGRVAQGGG